MTIPAAQNLTQSTVDSPVGTLTLVGSDRGLRALLWPTERDGRVTFAEQVSSGSHAVLDLAAEQLNQYFDGHRTSFDLPYDVVGTPFQTAVWAALEQIPFGETQSYGELAVTLDKPGAARAVGAATGRNPLSIVIPCHRLVGASGKLTGFAGGIEAKSWLLDHEAG